MRTAIASVMGLLVLSAAVRAAPEPTVVELFTSEGCSSCPPAEALIGVLARARPDTIALAFHVDYWDYIGWRDRFEIPAAAERQSQYARALHLSSVYTPQLVIDGRRDQVGGIDASGIPVSVRQQPFPVEIAVTNDRLQVSIGVDGTAGPRSGEPRDVLLLSVRSEDVSKITRGENAGRELHEFNIVRSLGQIGSWHGEAATWSVALKSLPTDADRAVVLVQDAHEGAIIAAASHTLSNALR